jgi:hypothetical protein
MEFARNVLIWAACFRHKIVFRFPFLRSDLFCHHLESTLATYQFLKAQQMPGLLCRPNTHVAHFVSTVVGQNRPRDSCDLVR